ncbi:MAG TPA: hypothetical protein VK522_16930 [Pseudolabrys sp.]|nr:hypothetical protein [Pseudolabrys sp.]
MITDTGVQTFDADSAVSWKAILAGAAGSIAISMILVAFGIGVGFTVVSPWNGQGVSGTTFTVAAGVYLFVVAMLSSTVGGYIAGRLRSRWHTVNEHERYFRDSAHGFVVWAVATIITAAVLGGATSSLIGGAASVAAAGAASQPSDIYVDQLLRTSPGQGSVSASQATGAQQATSPTAGDQTAAPLQGGQIGTTQRQNIGNRAEITRIIAPSMLKGGSVSDPDKKYLASVVASRSGLSQADAEARVDQVINQAKTAADKARKSAALFGLWLAAAMLAGALSAALAAIEGGNLRNREWYLEDTRIRAVVTPAE